jgi:hypothetical protein
MVRAPRCVLTAGAARVLCGAVARAGLTQRSAAAALATFAAMLGVTACGDDGGSDPEAPDYAKRIAFARVYINPGSISTSIKTEKAPRGGRTLEWTVPGQSSRTVGRYLASLEPTWITGLFRLEEGERPTPHQVDAWDRIHRVVRAKAPDAQFDVELNAQDYQTPREVRKTMRDVRSRLGNDGWFFDFWSPTYRQRPKVVEAAIDEAHDNEEFVGGNAFGWRRSADPVIPPNTDFMAVADSRFELDLDAVARLAERTPVIFHFSNNPTKPKSEGCVFMNDYTTAKREDYVTQRAGEQADNHFSFAYPVFFPSCQRGRKGGEPDVVAYDSLSDGSMPKTIEELMGKYN